MGHELVAAPHKQPEPGLTAKQDRAHELEEIIS